MNDEISILKVASCPSLSGRSILTYHIGCNGKEIYIQLQGNSSGGMFSKEWIGLDRFELSKEEPITARSIHEYFGRATMIVFSVRHTGEELGTNGSPMWLLVR